MNDKEVVRMIEPNACVEKSGAGWLVCKYPGGLEAAKAARLLAEDIYWGDNK